MTRIMADAIEFVRRNLTTGERVRCGNRVQIEDENGNPVFGVVTGVPMALSGTTAATATIIAAPASGTRIVVQSFVVQNEAATANTIQVHMGAATVGFRCLGQNQGDGLSKDFAKGNEWRGADGTALDITLSAGTAVGYSFLYYVETI